MPALEPECDLLWGLRSDPQLLRPRNASPRAAAVSLSYLSPPGALSCSTGPRGHCPSCSCFLRILLTNRCNSHKSHQSWTPCLLPEVTSFQAASLLTTPTPAPLNPDSPPRISHVQPACCLRVCPSIPRVPFRSARPRISFPCTCFFGLVASFSEFLRFQSNEP